jgi:hypothetical protein
MFWFWVIVVIVGLIGIAQAIAIGASRRADRLMKGMEKQYEDVVTALLAGAYTAGEQWEDQDNEQAVHIVLQTIKPHIDSLLSHINATDSSDVKVSFPTKYFANVATFADSLFYKRSKHKDTPLSQEDEDKMYAVLRDAINADLLKRKLYLKAGRSE